MLKIVPLEGRVPGGAALEFVSVQVPLEDDRYIPFALVHYSLNGKNQDYGLRLDIDKRSFADHFSDDREQVLQKAVPKIVEIVIETIRRFTFERLRKEFA